MIELIFILIVLEIIIGVWSLVRINNFTKKVSEANSELKASGFTGNISDLKNSLKKFNKQLKILKHQQMQETELNQVMNIYLDDRYNNQDNILNYCNSNQVSFFFFQAEDGIRDA